MIHGEDHQTRIIGVTGPFPVGEGAACARLTDRAGCPGKGGKGGFMGFEPPEIASFTPAPPLSPYSHKATYVALWILDCKLMKCSNMIMNIFIGKTTLSCMPCE